MHNKTPDVYQQLSRNAAETDLNIQKTASVLAAVAMLGIAGGVIQPYAAEAAPSTTTEIATNSEYIAPITQVENLSGYDIRVDQETKTKLAEATVGVLRRLKTPEGLEPGPWEEICTATVIKIPASDTQETLAFTAAHCDPSLKFSGQLYASPARDVLPASAYEFAVADAKDDPENRKKNPIGVVNSMSVSNKGLDIALFKITPIDQRTSDNHSRLLSEIEPMIYKPLTNPKPGQEVAITSIPEASGFHVGSTKGRYLGKFYLSDQFGTRLIAVVGINPPKPETDKCNYAASGSSAAAHGRLLTGLSIRVNDRGYHNGVVQPNDSLYRDPSTGELRPYSTSTLRASITREIGVDTSRYATLCGYNMPTGQDIKDLLNGFAHQVPVRPEGVAPVSDDPNVHK